MTAAAAPSSSRAQPRVLPVAGTCDSTGSCSIAMPGWRAGMWASWNLFLRVAGAVSFQVDVLSDGVPIGGGPAQGSGYSAGPIWSYGSSSIELVITGAPAGALVSGQAQGLEGPTLEDVASTTGPGFSTVGAAQQDPSQLLTGQLGPPLIDNQGVVVLGSGNHVTAFGPLDVSGYSALLIYGDPPPAVTAFLFARLTWYDGSGNQIAQQQLDNLCPKFVAVVGCLTSSVSLEIWNSDSAQHNLNLLTLIPLVEMPAHPEQLIPVAFGAASSTPLPLAPPAAAIINAAATVPLGQIQTFTGAYMWPGKAIWAVGQSAGAGAQVWDATLECVDATGNATLIARAGGVALPPPMEVQLTSGTPQVLYHNNASSGGQNMYTTLIASS